MTHMRNLSIVFLITVNCGKYTSTTSYEKPLLYVSGVEPATLNNEVKAISEQLKSILGYDVVSFDYNDVHSHSSYKISYNTQEIQNLADRLKKPVVGFCNNDTNDIYLPTPEEFYTFKNKNDLIVKIMLTKELLKSSLAHELGHAMGLKHVAGDPLMDTAINGGCIDHEAECLVNALIDQEKI